ncbi:MAG: DUF2442 domain-containing protein [Thermoguttaceae bacterium]|jgi:hypothetical protein
MTYPAVTSVAALADYRLLLGFANGDQRVFDVRPYLGSGVFAALKDVSVFRSVRVKFDTIEWANGADLCPEVLHELSVPAPPDVAPAGVA